MSDGIVIIGSGFAARQLVKNIRKQDPNIPLTLIAADSMDEYNKPDLSHVVSRGQNADDLTLQTAGEFAEQYNLRLFPHTWVSDIDADNQVVKSQDREWRYDKLVLATGATPFIPLVPGRELMLTLNSQREYGAAQSQLRDDVMRYGIYNRNLQAVPPTGSISYINHATSSIHPIVSKIEIRKEGKTGRVYYPAPFMTNDNLALYQDAYEIGPQKIIDTYAEATRHVDQGLSLTLFFPDTATTRDINKAQIYAWKKGIKTLYYIRLRQLALEGTEIEGCVSCAL